MRSQLSFIALGLIICAGCGDIGGNRRNASGSVAGTGLVGADPNAAGTTSTPPAAATPAGIQAVTGDASAPGSMSGPPPGAGSMAGPPPNLPGVNPAPAGEGGSLPGLPGVNLPGQSQPNVVTEKAQAGATGKGNYGPGVVTTPISVYFQAQERLIFDTVTHVMQIYEADHGHKPKTEEAFMKEIIEANQIRLPQLPPGSKYKYDPQSGELLVERPQQ
ncbi:MAG TPA: hypothetical protein VHC22_11260 [Pirellulales bacterium]|nr:hypothetical protein [Pirellulales bacterium]